LTRRARTLARLRWGLTLRSTADKAENRRRSYGDVRRNHAVFIDQVRNRRREQPVEPRYFSLSLQQDRKGQTVFLNLSPIRFRSSPADYDHRDPSTFEGQLLQLWR
jgi:hypothetical protein